MMYLYLFFILYAFTIFENIVFLLIFIETIVRFKVYIKPPKEWGKLLLNSGRTTGNKIAIGIWVIFALVCIWSNIQQNVLVLWFKIGIMILLIISMLLPKRMYENGLRDRVKFDPWSEIQSVTLHENNRVQILLKNPNIRRKINFVLRPGDKLPEAVAQKVSENAKA